MQRQVLVSLLWNKRRRDVWHVADSWIDNLQFGNHFVVELLWPRRERRARVIAVVEFGFLNLLSTNFNIKIRYRGKSSFHFRGINIVVMSGMSRILEILNWLFNVVNEETKLLHDIVFRSLVFHNKMLFKETSKFRVRCRDKFSFHLCGINIVAMSGMLRIQILLKSSLKKH